MILALKTSDKISELYLLSINNENKESKDFTILKEKKWQAERELAKTLLNEIEQLLDGKSFKELKGLIVFSGAGSFTGLRIGITTMNSISYSEEIPIIGISGENWLKDGIKKLMNGKNDKIVIPNYGAEPNITKPKTTKKRTP